MLNCAIQLNHRQIQRHWVQQATNLTGFLTLREEAGGLGWLWRNYTSRAHNRVATSPQGPCRAL